MGVKITRVEEGSILKKGDALEWELRSEVQQREQYTLLYKYIKGKESSNFRRYHDMLHSNCAAHYITLHYTTLKHYTTLHYTTLHCTTLHYTTLHYTTLHYTTLHYTTIHCTTEYQKVILTCSATFCVSQAVPRIHPCSSTITEEKRSQQND